MGFWASLRDLLEPKPLFCQLCEGREQLNGLPICESCLTGLPLCWEAFTAAGFACWSLAPYQGRMRYLLRALKYDGAYAVGLGLGRLAGLALRESVAAQKVHFVLPVPLHRERLMQRGFNQAAVLADGILREWRRPLLSGCERQRSTRPLYGLSGTERRQLTNVFSLVPNQPLRGRHVLIVDDILTTGSTFRQVAELVQSRGGRPMGVFAAISPRRGDSSAEKL